MSEDEQPQIPKFQSFSKDQLQFLFNHYDPKKTGYIRRDGLKTCILTYFSVENTHPDYLELIDYINILFNLADGNGLFNCHDGKLNFREFSQIMELLPAKFSSPKKSLLRMMFLMIDTDKTGYIERYEMKKLIDKSGLRMTNDEIKEKIIEMDLNDDGKVSIDEFLIYYGVDN